MDKSNDFIHIGVTRMLLLLVFIGLAFSKPAQAKFIAEGLTVTALTNDGRSTAAGYSYHGDWIAFLREESSTQKQLMIMKSDGSNLRAVSPIGNPYFAEWLWDGTKISYVFSSAADSQSQAQVYIYDLNAKKTLTVSAPYTRYALDEDDGPFFSPDGKYVAYNVRKGEARRGASRTYQLWIADVQSGKYWQILSDRNRVLEQRWSFLLPSRLCLRTEGTSGAFDIATVDPEGRKLFMLTDVGAQSVGTNNPRWSPAGEWVAFTSNIDMTQTERERRREDCWIARPDGSEARNLTKATSASTEEQLDINELYWSWDGRWILGFGRRFDSQGNRIDTLYLIDPVNGGYRIIYSSYPRADSKYNWLRAGAWSYDSKKLAIVMSRLTVRNWPGKPQYERPHSVVSVYDMEKDKFEDILIYDEDQDRKNILTSSRSTYFRDVSFSPDNRSILLTAADIISADDKVYQPDIYRLDLPDKLISPVASQNVGPPVGGSEKVPVTPYNDKTTQTAASGDSLAGQIEEAGEEKKLYVTDSNFVTATVKPMHLTVEEATSSLSSEYSKYFTTNPARNVILFKGPKDVLKSLRSDLGMIDTPSPHILVDMIAIELSDEANRRLGLDWTYAEGHFAMFQPEGVAVQKYPHIDTDEDYRAGFPSGALDSLNTIPGVGQSFYQGVGRLPREFYIRLNALIQDGKGTILANPRTVAISGQESLIQIRKTLNYFFNEGFDVSGRPIVKKSDITADTQGRITPTLLSDGRIHLKVDVKVGNFTFTSDAGLPELTTRQSTTQVDVNDGETLILGGLRQQEMSSITSKVPLLGDLPLIGPLFQKKQKSVQKSVLTILITPQIMNHNNPIPDWPVLNEEDWEIVPIMKDGLPEEKK